ncbi:ski complex tpr repeat subunit ski3 [Pelomyxa schiedti]|nr:ski complex tpr repeat subunit ski3 [Pelomyxa schiedti]
MSGVTPVGQLLRQAKACVEEKNWAEARTLCRTVLGRDQANYSANLMLGLSISSLLPTRPSVFGQPKPAAAAQTKQPKPAASVSVTRTSVGLVLGGPAPAPATQAPQPQSQSPPSLDAEIAKSVGMTEDDVKEGLAAFKLASGTEPNNPLAWKGLMDLCHKLGHWSDLIPAAVTLIKNCVVQDLLPLCTTDLQKKDAYVKLAEIHEREFEALKQSELAKAKDLHATEAKLQAQDLKDLTLDSYYKTVKDLDRTITMESGSCITLCPQWLSLFKESLELECLQIIEQCPSSPVPFEILYLLSEEDGTVTKVDPPLLGQKLMHSFPSRGVGWVAVGCASSNYAFHLSRSYSVQQALLETGLRFELAIQHLNSRCTTDNATFNKFMLEMSLYAGQSYAILGLAEKSLELLNIITEHPNTEAAMRVTALIGIGKHYSGKGDYSAANSIFCKALALEPKNHTALAESGWTFFQQKEYKQAQVSLEKAVSLCKDIAHYHYWLGRVYWELGGTHRSQQEFAYQCFITATTLGVSQNDACVAQAYTFLGHYSRVVANTRDFAHSCYRKALSIDLLDEAAGRSLSDSLMESNMSDEAFQLHKQITDCDSAFDRRAAWAWFRKGQALLIKGDGEEAMKSFLTVLRSEPRNTQCWLLLGKSYVIQGKLIAALKCFSKVATLEPENIYALYQAATVQQQIGNLEESIIQYRQILSTAPRHVPSMMRLAEVLHSQAISNLNEGFIGRSCNSFKEAASAAAQASQAGNVSCLWKLLGDILTFCYHLPLPLDEKKAHLLSAQNAFNTALKLQPSILNLKLDVGIVLTLRSRLEPANANKLLQEAISTFKEVISLSPNNVEGWNALGVILIPTNKLASQHCFIRALLLDSKNPTVWNNLGLLYLLSNEPELAKQAYTCAHRINYMLPDHWFGEAVLCELDETNKEPCDPTNSPEVPPGGELPVQNGHEDHGSTSPEPTHKRKGKSKKNKELSWVKKALEGYEQSLSTTPTYYAQRAYGFACYVAGDYENARQALHCCARQNPEDIATLNTLGLSLEGLGHEKPAAEVFKKAISLLQQPRERAKQDTSKEHKRTKTVTPKSPQTNTVYDALNVNYIRASVLADPLFCPSISDLPPVDPWTLTTLCIALCHNSHTSTSQRDYIQKIEACLKSLKPQQHMHTILALACLHIDEKRWESAIHILSTCTVQYATIPSLWNLMCISQFGAGNITAALSAVRKAIDCGGMTLETCHLATRLFLHQDQYSSAKAALLACIHTNPCSISSWKAILHLALQFLLPKIPTTPSTALNNEIKDIYQLSKLCLGVLTLHENKPWYHFLTAIVDWLAPTAILLQPNMAPVAVPQTLASQESTAPKAQSPSKSPSNQTSITHMQHFVHGHPDKLLSWMALLAATNQSQFPERAFHSTDDDSSNTTFGTLMWNRTLWAHELGMKERVPRDKHIQVQAALCRSSQSAPAQGTTCKISKAIKPFKPGEYLLQLAEKYVESTPVLAARLFRQAAFCEAADRSSLTSSIESRLKQSLQSDPSYFPSWMDLHLLYLHTGQAKLSEHCQRTYASILQENTSFTKILPDPKHKPLLWT